MPMAERDGAELYWEKTGSGPSLILGAGLNGAGTWWTPNIPALATRFTVYTFDQRGTGRSTKVPVASIGQMAADLVAVMDQAGVDAAHYCGHSTGGAIGVATALDFPGRLRSLLICSSPSCGDAYRRKLLGLRRTLFENLGGEAYAQFRTLLLYPPYWINANHKLLAEQEARDTGDLGDARVQGSRLDAILAFDRRGEFGRIALPTLVVCADDDILAPRYFSEQYQRLIPKARAHYLPRGGHAITKTEPDVFNRIALEFFTRLETP
jgi:aminoacrylate hydrolase